jgi:signal transduction histidine kinase
MFQRARLRLTAWYVAFLVAILLVLDVAVVIVLSRSLDARLAEDLRAKAGQASAAVIDFGGAPVFERGALGSDPGWSDVALSATTASGDVLLNASPVVGSILPDRDGVNAAILGRSGFTTVKKGSDTFLIYSEPVYAPSQFGRDGGNVIAVIQVARSTRHVVEAMGRLALLLVVATAAAAGAAFLGGLWLAGKALAPIRASVQRQKQFVGDASHELRTPVTVIRAAAESILRQKEKPSDRVQSLAQDIVSESGQLGRLADDLGLLVDDSAMAQQARDPVAIGPLLADVTRSAHLLAESKGVILLTDTEVAGVVHGNASRLRQLLSILLDNAVKFSRPGAEVRVAAEISGRHLTLRVIDKGPGIPEAELPRVFERFYRGETERQHEGSGLGLAIAQAIVEQHGGTIAVRSKVGEGSEFVVELPL